MLKNSNRIFGFIIFQLDDDQCRRTRCKTGINCCLTSQPCFHEGICIPLLDKNERFNCECADGYTGPRCTKKAKSCRAFLNGNQQAGNFQIFDKDDNLYTVYCSFDDEIPWTLVQSFKYSKRNERKVPIYQDNPKNQNFPSWSDYRLSFSRMNGIHEDSNSKWRLTCNFNRDGPVYTDYVRTTHAAAPLLNSAISQYDECKTVEYIDIRTHSCTNCQVLVAHGARGEWPLHIDSYYSTRRCSAHFPESKACNGSGEDNFGYYDCANAKHRCSATEESTTQVWFGGK